MAAKKKAAKGKKVKATTTGQTFEFLVVDGKDGTVFVFGGKEYASLRALAVAMRGKPLLKFRKRALKK